MVDHGRLLLIRHAHTAGNAAAARMGSADLPLDATGVVQAAALVDALSNLELGTAHLAVRCSPLLRARQTIASFAEKSDLNVQIDARLAEMNFGTATDRRVKIKEQYLHDPLPGGESLYDVWLRCASLWAELAPVLHESNLVVVAHYRLLQLFACRVAGGSFEEAVASGFRPANASVHQAHPDSDAEPVLVWRPDPPPPAVARDDD